MRPEGAMFRRPAQLAVGVLAWFWCVSVGLTAPWNASPARQSPVPASAASPLSDTDIEHFLLNAKVIKTKGAGKGVTGSIRATLSEGTLTHDAHIQIIDESKREFRSAQGVEFNFRDSWMFNVAAYRINRLLGLDLVPVSVARRWRTNEAAYTWWVDDVLMDEGGRLKNKTSPPNPRLWNEQMQMVRLFDQLIYNIDRNLGNLLITNTWRVWAIDHTRAFRTAETLKTPANIARCDRQVFERLKQLDRATLKSEVGDYLQNWEIDSLLKRRDAIVALIDQRGDAGLFDLQRE
jgi:hypothetical protein